MSVKVFLGWSCPLFNIVPRVMLMVMMVMMTAIMIEIMVMVLMQ